MNIKNFVFSRLQLINISVRDVANDYGCQPQAVYNALYGRTYKKLRLHIAQSCGYANWQALEQAAQSAHQSLKQQGLIH